MSRRGTSRAGESSRRAEPSLNRRSRDDYWSLSARPLHSLVLLAPLVLLYEIGSIQYLQDADARTQKMVAAEKQISDFLHVFGLVGLLLPGVAMLVILLVWHVLSRDRWQIRPAVWVGMVLEAALWMVPLLVYGSIVSHMPLVAALQGTDPATSGLSWQGRATLSLGAGLYEELLFRFIAIGLIHLLVKDILQGTEMAARVLAVIGSAVLFAFYHKATLAGGAVHFGLFFLYAGAGIYFAIIYLFRGFGIVVATHAFYDLMVLVIVPELQKR